MTSRALITGVTGQDGAYLASLLLSLGYKVIGGIRRSSSPNNWRLRYLGIHDHANLELVPFDITDPVSCARLVDIAHAHEIYNLAAQSFVGLSFEAPLSTMLTTGMGALNMLEAARRGGVRFARFYQASSSEMFNGTETLQSEDTSFKPRSPYGVAKLMAHSLARIYRESYHMHICCGILFNHESPLRGEEFVTRKISMGMARLAVDLNAAPIQLGNLNAARDWGHAAEYVSGMHQILTADQKPADYVLATGVTTSISSFVLKAARAAGFEPVIVDGPPCTEDTEIIDVKTGRKLVEVSPVFYRPNEVHTLCGDARKARSMLNWQPTVDIDTLAHEMVSADLRRLI